VVVIDNGSSDDTAAVARRFESRLPNFSLLRTPNPGYQARALNYGMSQSKGEALIFLDSDDVVGPDYLLHVAKALVDAPFVGARVDIHLLNPPEVQERRRPLQQERIDSFCDYLPAVIGAAMGGRREPLERVGGFDETLPTQHDLDISWRLAAAGYPATLVREATLHYRYRTGARAIFQQEHGYGMGEVVLYRKFRSQGMRRRTVPRVVVAYARMLIALLGLPQAGGASRFATMLGMNLGRLQGSIRHRTFYL
jgi:GT2 family glycosyltransferase